MPELPEVETIRLQLNRVLTGLKITDVKVLSQKNFIGRIGELIDRKIISVNRRAKLILIELDNGNYIAIHLKMTGQLIFKDIGEMGPCKINCSRYDVSGMPNKYTRVILGFNKAKLYFNDLRKFGWMKIVTKLELKILNQDYGPEPFDKNFSNEYLKNTFSKTSKPIKIVLLDQEKIAGIGNIYANEALFKAGIIPTKPAKKLNNQEIDKLRKAIISILTESIKRKGTSDKDEAYRQISGEKGQFQNYLKVYNRENEECSKGNGKIKKIKIGGRGTFYCPICQK